MFQMHGSSLNVTFVHAIMCIAQWACLYSNIDYLTILHITLQWSLSSSHTQSLLLSISIARDVTTYIQYNTYIIQLLYCLEDVMYPKQKHPTYIHTYIPAEKLWPRLRLEKGYSEKIRGLCKNAFDNTIVWKILQLKSFHRW